MRPSLSLQRMVSRSVGGRLAPALVLLCVAAACGGDRAGSAADSNAVATAGTDTAPPVSATDTAAATPDTIVKPAAKDTTSAAAKPGTGSTGKDSTAAAKPAPKPATPKPAAPAAAAPKPAPKPAPARDTAAAAPAPAPSQAAQDTAKPPAEAAKAPSGQPSGDAPLRDAYHQAPRDTVSQAVYDGWKQYNLNCARCHGEDVLGTTIAPHLIVSLKPDGPINTKELFMQTVCAGRPAKGMPAWCSLGLGMDKIDAIYAYVHGRSAGEIGPGRPAVKQGG